jgi:hypothetical protein
MNKQFLMLSLLLLVSGKVTYGASFREESLRQFEEEYKKKAGIPEEKKLHLTDLLMDPRYDDMDPEPIDKPSLLKILLRKFGANLAVLTEWLAMWAQIIKVKVSAIFVK